MLKVEDTEDNKAVYNQKAATAATEGVPSVDPESLSTTAKRRMRTSREEMAILESYYKNNPNPSQQEKQHISQVVQMAEKSVHFWFQNRRAKDNKRKRILEGNRINKNAAFHKGKRTGNRTQQKTANKNTNTRAEALNDTSYVATSFASDPLLACTSNPTSLVAKNANYYPSSFATTHPIFDSYHQQQQQRTDSRYNLPPISSIVTPQHYNGINNDATGSLFPAISFYFHHPDFGIENCMTQWFQHHQYHESSAAMSDPTTSTVKEWHQHQQQQQQQH